MLYTSFYNILCCRLSLQCSNTTKKNITYYHIILIVIMKAILEKFSKIYLFPLSLVPPEPTLRCPIRCLHWFLDKVFCLQQNHIPTSSENEDFMPRTWSLHPDCHILLLLLLLAFKKPHRSARRTHQKANWHFSRCYPNWGLSSQGNS